MSRWTSMTKQFDPTELDFIKTQDANSLLAVMLDSNPVVALRVMAEILHNHDQDKLNILLASDELTKHWRQFEKDLGLVHDDIVYAYQLEQSLEKLNQ